MIEKQDANNSTEKSPHSVESWGCTASDMGAKTATCCSDDDSTGCPSGYQCRMHGDDSTEKSRYDCVRYNQSNDPFLAVLPRYRLCPAEESNRKLYGLTVPSNASQSTKIAYYSNLGPIQCYDDAKECNEPLSSQVQMALIVVHGANRNADDYFCSAKATIGLQDRYPPSSVLVITPFFAMTPPSTNQTDASTFFYWNDTDDQDGSWRYGADSTGPTRVSSFATMDAIIESLQSRHPNLQTITIAGHSSGGQFVQRWSLLTPIWPNADDRIQIRAIVANPSNYAYLTPLRFFETQTTTTSTTRMLHKESNKYHWKVPMDLQEDCPQYNQWEWGLDDGGDMDVPYRQQVMAKEGKSAIVGRYLFHRSVIYLIGNLDRCSEGETNQQALVHCESHGLETTCADELQGRNRYERHLRYWASLELVAAKHNRETNAGLEPLRSSHKHRRMVVPNVGHDHSMMFQSQEGIEAIYYDSK